MRSLTGLCFSPFKVHAGPVHDASKVRASGPGLDSAGVAASIPVEFTIDARDAGEGLLTVQILVSPVNIHIRFMFTSRLADSHHS